MANEYLKRTPTSTGNRRTFTISLWMKKSADGNQKIFTNDTGPGSNNGSFYLMWEIGGQIRIGTYYAAGGGWLYTLLSNTLFRDYGNWFHICCVIDTSKASSPRTIRVWINGAEVNNISSYIDYPANHLTNLSNVQEHRISSTLDNTSYTYANLTDFFFIDGQALTPDVFGFYKEGKGYQSSGSTQSTDFRPGQWVPKAPRTIKSEINRRGGFGVNGFYLPMNDSSNFGADFHITPNSIITLKGEDLPQPRNGAPDTTDAYVSQLRSDPYAANLVLAVPGISGGQGSGYGDYSADIKGSGSNKTITANGNATVATTASYYGSALSFDGTNDYFTTPNSSDFYFNGDFTVECWIYRNVTNTSETIVGVFENSSARRSWMIETRTNSAIRFQWWSDGSSSSDITSANDSVPGGQWHHIAMVKNNDIMTGYVNGVAVGTDTTAGSIYENTDDPLRIGILNAAEDQDFNGYIQDLRVYKGVAKYKGGFDVPKPYTPVGIATWRAVPDCTANNFATLNPLTNSNAPLTNGNLTMSPSGNNATAWSTFAVKSGKWYWEVYKSSGDMSLMLSQLARFNGYQPGSDTTSLSLYMYYTSGGASTNRFVYNSSNTAFPSGFGDDDNGTLYNFFLDFDTNTFKVRRNNDAATEASFSMPAALVSEPLFIGYSVTSTWPAASFTYNFGQNPTFSGNTTAGTYTDANGKGLFKYQPPTGFLALCEDNLPTPSIADPGDYFKTVLWTGDGNAGRNITSVGFKPDLVWIKERSSTSSHALFDSVRGAGNRLVTNSTDAEQSGFESVYNPSFNNNGFTVGSDGAVNQNGQTYVAWCWKAGGAAVSNTDGGLTSQVSVNQTAGFSIVSWTGNNTSGASVGHGLGKEPSMIILKSRGPTARSWGVYHKSIGNTGLVYLDLTNSTNTATFHWNDTSPTSSVFTLGNGSVTGSAEDYIGYCWTEIEGFSKFGSYVGNGNADGPFVYCGFKPAWILYKRYEGGLENWEIFDSSRQPTNPATLGIKANTSDTEAALLSNGLDLLSNGFKIRENATRINASGGSYIFAAFAESAFSYSNAK